TVTGPSSGSFAIDAGGAIPLNVGGTTATTLNLGRSGQTQALLGNATVAGTFAVTGTSTHTGAATFSSTITGPSSGSFAIDAVGDASNTLTTQTPAAVNTGNGLTSGQALAVNAGSSTFTNGNTQDGANATRGFFYGGAAGSYKGASTFSSTGNFTGTLVALTADQTTAGTVLGISAQSLTTGKAIDVSLGTLYSGTTDSVAGYSVGAVNVRAQSFTGNILNVEAHGAGGASANLANFTSTQLAGNVANVTGNSLTTGTAVNVSAPGASFSGKAVSVTLGNNTGTAFYVNTGETYTGNLVQLQVNAVDKLKVDASGNTTLGGTLTVRGASITGPSAGAFAIDNGNASAINLGNNSGAAPIN